MQWTKLEVLMIGIIIVELGNCYFKILPGQFLNQK